jgi:uncharacterized protein (TIGR02246 family)
VRVGNDEQSIRQLVATWHEATAAGDVSRILPLMADDVVFLVPGHAPMRGRQSFEQGLRTLLRDHKISSTSEIQEIGISGEIAYCWSVLSVTITPLAQGSPNRRKGHVLTVLKKQPDGGWVVFRDANMLVPEPEVTP